MDAWQVHEKTGLAGVGDAAPQRHPVTQAGRAISRQLGDDSIAAHDALVCTRPLKPS